MPFSAIFLRWILEILRPKLMMCSFNTRRKRLELQLTACFCRCLSHLQAHQAAVPQMMRKLLFTREEKEPIIQDHSPKLEELQRLRAPGRDSMLLMMALLEMTTMEDNGWTATLDKFQATLSVMRIMSMLILSLLTLLKTMQQKV